MTMVGMLCIWAIAREVNFCKAFINIDIYFVDCE